MPVIFVKMEHNSLIGFTSISLMTTTMRDEGHLF